MYKLIFILFSFTCLYGCIIKTAPCFFEESDTNMIVDDFEYVNHGLKITGRSVKDGKHCKLVANCYRDIEGYLQVGDTIVKDSGSVKITMLGKHKITYYDQSNNTTVVNIVDRIP